jgi:DNA-binding XRE family transcriptional regulator
MESMEVDEELLYRVVGKDIRERRKEMNMTQSRLAAEVGVLRTSVTNIETGHQKPPLHLLFKICAVLDIEAKSILPQNSEVVRLDAVPVQLDGEVRLIPPKAAEALERLRGPEPKEGSS